MSLCYNSYLWQPAFFLVVISYVVGNSIMCSLMYQAPRNDAISLTAYAMHAHI